MNGGTIHISHFFKRAHKLQFTSANTKSTRGLFLTFSYCFVNSCDFSCYLSDGGVFGYGMYQIVLYCYLSDGGVFGYGMYQIVLYCYLSDGGVFGYGMYQIVLYCYLSDGGVFGCGMF